MTMVSDEEIASCVESLLRQSSSSAAAAGSVWVAGDVVQQLEAKLGMSLAHKAEFIKSLLRPPNPSSKDHFALHQQQQQQQQQRLHPHNQQQQYYQLQHPILQHHQIPQSPFTHLPQQHELAFRCVSPLQMQQQHRLQQLQQQQQAMPAAAAASAAAAMQKQEGHLVAGGSAPAPPTKASGTAGVKRRGGPGGLSKLCGVSPELQAIVGEPALPRTQIVKQLWAYIRKHNLQDPNNKRKIICNDELRLVFETDCTDMFKMNKLLAKHIISLEPTKKPSSDSKRLKARDIASTTESNPADSPLVISDALAEFFGTGEKEIVRSEASKRVWDYIKVNQLEDPLNAMAINFDAKLQKLFGCESLSALGVSEMLSRHLFKKS